MRQEGAYYPSTSCLCLFSGRMRRKKQQLKNKRKKGGNKAESLYPVSLLMSFGNCSLSLFHCTRTVKEEIRGIPTTTAMCLSVLVCLFPSWEFDLMLVFSEYVIV